MLTATYYNCCKFTYFTILLRFTIFSTLVLAFFSVEVGEGSGSGLSLMTSEVWSDEKWLGSRAQFRPETFPAVLRVHEVAGSDAGQYRCRVDFREAPTRNTLVNLTVVGKEALFVLMVHR